MARYSERGPGDYDRSAKHRKRESEGMKKYEKKMHKAPAESFKVGHDPMVGRDDFAGLPPECIMKMYPKPVHGVGGNLDDSIVGIDDVQEQAAGFSRKHLSNQK